MTFKKLLKIAWRSVKANKSRSLLTTLGVIIGVASVIILVSIGSGLKDYITSEMQDMGSNLVMVMPGDINLDKMGAAGGSAISSSFASMQSSKLKLDYIDDIRQGVPQIKDLVGLVMASAPVRYKNELVSSQVMGTTENYTDLSKYNFVAGGFFNKADVNSGRKMAVVGHKIAEDLFGDSPAVGEKIKVGDYRYTVVGVIEEKGGQIL